METFDERMNSKVDIEQIEVKLFLQSSCFSYVQETIKLFNHLVRKDGSNEKFDIESNEGQKACSLFLKSVQKLALALNISYSDRSYIERFSKAYKVLYADDNTIYLPEIFDSAQEGYSYLWVNGEKYVFSDDVLNSGKKLKEMFFDIQAELQQFETLFRSKLTNAEFRELKTQLNEYLEDFDKAWSTYEKNYILELMVIESDSRRFVKEAIDVEKEITLLEKTPFEKHGSPTKDRKGKLRKAKHKLVELISKINSVANTNGKGRDDLTYEILEIADKRRLEICQMKLDRKIQLNKSSFYKLYENLNTTLANLRVLFAKYAENIEVVDPQLKNNTELVEGITDFENVWSKAKVFLTDDNKFRCFIVLSQYIDYLNSEYDCFKSLTE